MQEINQELKKFVKETIEFRKNPEDLLSQMDQFRQLMTIYKCGIREVQTKLEILNDEFNVKQNRNPIELIKSRMKQPDSIFNKLARKGCDISLNSITRNINDVAGVRVICSFIDDIYFVADTLLKQEDIVLITMKDYIREPKSNGYRSLHLVIEVPVYFSDRKQMVRVEVQIRTIAMDFWASLEHEIHYKKGPPLADSIALELKECADVIAQTDARMQEIHNRLKKMQDTDKSRVF